MYDKTMGIDMKTREEIEKEIKEYERTIRRYERTLEYEEIPSRAANITKEMIARVDSSIAVLKWVLGDSNE